GREAARHLVLVTDPRAEVDAPARERVVGRSDEHERQILVVAHHRRHRDEHAAMLLARLDLYAHEHVATQYLIVVWHENANGHSLRARISERGDVVDLPRQWRLSDVRDDVRRLADRDLRQLVR